MSSEMVEKSASNCDEKAAIFEAVSKMLAECDPEALAAITFKSIKEKLIPTFGESVSLYKDEIKSHLVNAMMQSTSIATEEVEEEEEETEDDDASETDEESPDDPIFANLPEEWKSQYGSIVWIKFDKKCPW